MKRLVVAFGILSGSALCATGAEAASILFAIKVKVEDSSLHVSGDHKVATLRFDDVGANQVKVTVKSSLNAASEFLSDLAFNIKPTFTPSAITATYIASSQVGAFSLPGLQQGGQNTQNPSGPTSGYDFNFSFTTSNSQQGTKRFNLNDSFQYLFTAPGLTTADFDIANAASHFAYTQVQGIGPNGASTGYVGGPPTAVPEPTGILLLMIGAGAAFAQSRKH